VEAAEKADSLGVDIINTSLGYFEFDNTTYNHTYSDMDGITAFISRGAEIAFSRGMIVVASAGNEGSTLILISPADAVSVLAIGAVNSIGNRASLVLQVPLMTSVKPDLMAQGSTVLSNEFGTIITANGTSFSGPVLAGMVVFLAGIPKTKKKSEI
jgi:subtilisin family serine protease